MRASEAFFSQLRLRLINRNPRDWINVVFIILFFLFVSVGLWIRWVGFNNQPLNAAIEDQDPFPPIKTFQNLIAFAPRFETYFSEHFPVRSSFAHIAYWSQYEILKKKIYPKLVIGKESWLYYTDEQNIEDYQKNNLLNAQKIDQMQKNIDTWGLFFENQDIPFFILIVPNKETIYPEYLPDFIQPIGINSRLDQILSQIKFPKNVHIIDPRENLIQGKNSQIIYHKTDTHYNIYGACITYAMTIDAIKSNNLIKDSFRCNDLNITNKNMGGDISAMLTLQGIITENSFDWKIKTPIAVINNKDTKWIVSQTTNSNQSKAFVYRDSFFAALLPLFSENFRQVDYYWTFNIDFDRIKREHPDVVVLEFAERYAESALLETYQNK